MKILVINLLRIGDVLQATPVIEGLRLKHPGARVDALVFAGVDRLAPIVSGIDRWWTLDRDGLQAGLGQPGVPLLTSLDVLNERVAEIDAAGYDLVINLSHTEFSAHVAGLIGAGARVGVHRDERGRAHIDSPWFAYLDLHARRPGADVFHHLDVFWHACGLNGLVKTWTYDAGEEGRAELAALGLGSGRVVACQPFTSDLAKDWDVARWAEALSGVALRRPGVRFAILGAPNEADRVRALAAGVVGARPAVTSLAGALAVIDRADVLVTGDTSIKHLAAGTKTPVLELCLGPSEYRRTGVYRPNSCLVATPNGRADEIPPALIAGLIEGALDGRGFTPAAPSPATAKVLRPCTVAGFWCAVPPVALDQRPPALAHLDFLAGDPAEQSTPMKIRVKLIETLRTAFAETW